MEKKYAKFFKTKHAISVNSWTSGLICAVGAIDTSPGGGVPLLSDISYTKHPLTHLGIMPLSWTHQNQVMNYDNSKPVGQLVEIHFWRIRKPPR